MLKDSRGNQFVDSAFKDRKREFDSFAVLEKKDDRKREVQQF